MGLILVRAPGFINVFAGWTTEVFVVEVIIFLRPYKEIVSVVVRSTEHTENTFLHVVVQHQLIIPILRRFIFSGDFVIDPEVTILHLNYVRYIVKVSFNVVGGFLLSSLGDITVAIYEVRRDNNVMKLSFL